MVSPKSSESESLQLGIHIFVFFFPTPLVIHEAASVRNLWSSPFSLSGCYGDCRVCYWPCHVSPSCPIRTQGTHLGAWFSGARAVLSPVSPTSLACALSRTALCRQDARCYGWAWKWQARSKCWSLPGRLGGQGDQRMDIDFCRADSQDSVDKPSFHRLWKMLASMLLLSLLLMIDDGSECRKRSFSCLWF